MGKSPNKFVFYAVFTILFVFLLINNLYHQWSSASSRACVQCVNNKNRAEISEHLHKDVKIVPSFPDKPLDKDIKCVDINLRQELPSIDKAREITERPRLCLHPANLDVPSRYVLP